MLSRVVFFFFVKVVKKYKKGSHVTKDEHEGIQSAPPPLFFCFFFSFEL